ncbi:MAG: TetR/AcrR family transcriptional regulator; helix-turn-helix transcriptional regulator [Acidimicrobiia bacterium]|nr:TetR/AcrR family transcriptional regulator; helix-turn-helix transcriptional regulator [Acidimicrobiia bacterium]
MPKTKPKRGYDATKRRERAEEERRETRRRVLAAAQKLFVENGYRGTTMADIATEAGVAMQSVYKAGRSKADLLQRVVELVVAGDDQPVLFTERPSVGAIAEEPDAARQVEMIAALIASTQERSAPVQAALREAAALDDTVAANLEAELQRRHETIRTIVGMIAGDRLRLPRAECVDTVWAIGSSEVYLLLRVRRGWSARRFRDWLTRTLSDQILATDDG